MSRAEGARRDQNTDIPVAHRINPIRRFSSKRLGQLAISSVFISISATVFLFYFIYKPSLIEKAALNDANSIRKESLLGHYPYPEVSADELVMLYPGFKVHKVTLVALKRMQADAYQDGIELVFLSGFRSIDLQREIFYENKSIRNQIAVERSKVSAPPGYSEHSTGYAVDIGDRNMRETDFEVSFELTPAFKWLEKNAAKYHFVLSFPKGNVQKISYEPWHWRYEGTVKALKQFEPANRSVINHSR